jgi:dTDP-4-dehydrorhamnose reductase
MAGHVITRYLESLNKYEIINVALEKLNDETIIANVEEKELVKEIISKFKPSVIINCIGLLVDASSNRPDLAIYLNSFFPHYLAELGKRMNFKLIHLSTDCVFSGNKGNYSENDFKDGEDMYARTKALGEIINNKDLTFRLSIIGPEIRENATGLFHWFMTQKGEIWGYNKVYWTGVTTLELAKAIDSAIDQNLTSLYHLVPKKKISKFALLNFIKEVWGKSIIIKNINEPKHDKSLINTRKDFNYEIPDYRTMLMELYEWMKNWNYRNYQQ